MRLVRREEKRREEPPHDEASITRANRYMAILWLNVINTMTMLMKVDDDPQTSVVYFSTRRQTTIPPQSQRERGSQEEGSGA